MTGLRRKELGSLTPRSFKLDASPPTVTVQAACSKHRRKDILPLHPELVVMLRVWLKGMKPADKLFPNLENKKTWLMVKKDLERVGIPYETDEGIADFHAAGRHTHITELLRNGATLPEAKELARHSDVNMTMRYTHIGIEDQAKAVANLPAPKGRPAEPASRAAQRNPSALQMRCIFCSAKGHSVTSAGNGQKVQKRQNPWQAKGFDNDRRQVSPPDKVEAAGIEPAAKVNKTRERMQFPNLTHSRTHVVCVHAVALLWRRYCRGGLSSTGSRRSGLSITGAGCPSKERTEFANCRVPLGTSSLVV